MRARPAHGARPQLSIPSAVTLLRPDGVFYRGTDATALAATHSFEQVAELLWLGDGSPGRPWQPPAGARTAAAAAAHALPGHPLPLERLQVAVGAVAATDPLRFDVTPAAVRRLAPGLISSLAGALRPRGEAASGQPAQPPAPIAGDLAASLSGRPPPPGLIRALNAALILLADHELAASTLAVRIAAATRAPVYGCIAAGLGVLQGRLHGGTSLRAEDLLAQIGAPDEAPAVIHALLSRGDPLWGFGHPAYENGDPRAAALLRLVLPAAPEGRRAAAESVLAFAKANGLPPPNTDFALGALTHCWSLTRGSGQAIFAVARTAGWVAHAIEEYERRSDYRIRGTYTGPAPRDARQG